MRHPPTITLDHGRELGRGRSVSIAVPGLVLEPRGTVCGQHRSCSIIFRMALHREAAPKRGFFRDDRIWAMAALLTPFTISYFSIFRTREPQRRKEGVGIGAIRGYSVDGRLHQVKMVGSKENIIKHQQICTIQVWPGGNRRTGREHVRPGGRCLTGRKHTWPGTPPVLLILVGDRFRSAAGKNRRRIW